MVAFLFHLVGSVCLCPAFCIVFCGYDHMNETYSGVGRTSALHLDETIAFYSPHAVTLGAFMICSDLCAFVPMLFM